MEWLPDPGNQKFSIQDLVLLPREIRFRTHIRTLRGDSRSRCIWLEGRCYWPTLSGLL